MTTRKIRNRGTSVRTQLDKKKELMDSSGWKKSVQCLRIKKGEKVAEESSIGVTKKLRLMVAEDTFLLSGLCGQYKRSLILGSRVSSMIMRP